MTCKDCIYEPHCILRISYGMGDDDEKPLTDMEKRCKPFKNKADYAEVKHGHNATSMHPVDEFLCSECGFCCADYTETKYDEDGDYTYSCECEFDYCPRCGAKMDGNNQSTIPTGSE